MTEIDDDPPPEAAEADHIEIAFHRHADPALLEQYFEKKERLERYGRRQYVGNVHNPDGYVFSELDDFTQRLLAEKLNAVVLVDADLTSKLRDGRLVAWARVGSPLGPWSRIPSSAWRTLRLHKLVGDAAMEPEFALFDIRIGIPVAIQPSDATSVSLDNGDLVQSAKPGRPSNHAAEMIAEFERRVRSNEFEPTLAAEARWLQAWCGRTYPGDKVNSVGAIRNSIRKLYPKAKSRKF